MLGGSIALHCFSANPHDAMLVDLNTPGGSVFSGHADGVELRTTDGVIAIQSGAEKSYINLTETTEITLRINGDFRAFALKNAAASLRDGRLTLIAEEVQPLPAKQAHAAP
jgi:F0F1-type ATP synthase epsilon subunit